MLSTFKLHLWHEGTDLHSHRNNIKCEVGILAHTARATKLNVNIRRLTLLAYLRVTGGKF